MSNTKSYNLAMSTQSYNSLKQIATDDDTSVADLLRKSAKLLIYLRSIAKDPNARLLVERNGEIQEIVLDFVL